MFLSGRILKRIVISTLPMTTSNRRLLLNRKMSSSKGDEEENDVILESVANKGVITLNRPKALNALNLSMVNKIYPALIKWESEKTMVLVKGAGGKAFCSGGDIRAVVVAGLKGEKLGQEFFRTEYTMNGLIATYKIPYVALIDGIVMGGGVGLSVHGTYRVATDKTLFAMPESAIGLFADVGTSYFLPRLKGKLGWYLALTGHRLRGSDVLKAGIATHYCESAKLHELEQALLNEDCSDNPSIRGVLNKFCLREDQLPEFSLSPYLKKIDFCFSAPTVEEILERLKNDDSDWAKQTFKTFSEVSPTAVKVTFHELNLGSNMSLPDCLTMEYRIAMSCLENHDFYEGVRALLIDKDKNPKWKPATYAEVTEQMVEKYFRKLPEDQELKHKL